MVCFCARHSEFFSLYHPAVLTIFIIVYNMHQMMSSANSTLFWQFPSPDHLSINKDSPQADFYEISLIMAYSYKSYILSSSLYFALFISLHRGADISSEQHFIKWFLKVQINNSHLFHLALLSDTFTKGS